MKFASVIFALATLASVPLSAVAQPTTTNSSPDALTGPARRLFPEGPTAPLPTGAVLPPVLWTNAQRLRRGLLPKAPRTPATPTKRNFASPTHYSGHITVHYPKGAKAPLSGTNYLATHPNKYGFFGVTNDKSKALSVAFATTAQKGDDFSIKATNPKTPSLRYVGAISGYDVSSKDLSESSGAYAAFGYSVETPKGVLAKEVDNGFTAATKKKVGVESGIWEYDTSSTKLTPTWINSNGKPAKSQSIVYVESEQFFALTSNPTIFAKDYGAKVISSVTFKLSS